MSVPWDIFSVLSKNIRALKEIDYKSYHISNKIVYDI